MTRVFQPLYRGASYSAPISSAVSSAKGLCGSAGVSDAAEGRYHIGHVSIHAAPIAALCEQFS